MQAVAYSTFRASLTNAGQENPSPKFVQVLDSGVIRWELDLTTHGCNGGE